MAYTLTVDTERELIALRDAVSELTVQQRQHVKSRGANASAGAKQRLADLEGLLADLKAKIR